MDSSEDENGREREKNLEFEEWEVLVVETTKENKSETSCHSLVVIRHPCESGAIFSPYWSFGFGFPEAFQWTFRSLLAQDLFNELLLHLNNKTIEVHFIACGRAGVVIGHD
ncbi:hypothetical protein V6N13_141402 [Hibiscus sabdariffa]|uniref:Uncharacterized protein n=2 Tax=Hibiscus sabdariffa TaxID=183260 RepID=A0ABR2P4U1_9ROSI